ncbi:MAG: 16S rRNA (guanine(966)-N(2))-methyltransferase RsmD [Hyphomicrobiaceae bacterium]
MRIVAGRLRGRPIATPAHDGLRPTSDRVRESLFNILAHAIPGFELDGAKVIDLFAGTGALGLEALSRGAAFCLFVEDDADARALIRRNVEDFGLSGVTKIFRRDATSLGPAGSRGGMTLAFLDPPYGKGLAEKALVALTEGWLATGAVVAVEERADVTVAPPAGFTALDHRVYGETQVLLLRFDGR